MSTGCQKDMPTDRRTERHIVREKDFLASYVRKIERQTEIQIENTYLFRPGNPPV